MASLTQNIHLANNMGQDVHVMVGLTEEWQIIDGVVDAAELIAACADVAALPEAATMFLSGLPAEVETLADLAQFTKTVATFAYKIGSASNSMRSSIQNMVSTFRKSAICIPAGQEQNVSHMDLSTILQPSTIASFAGASTIQLVIMSDDNNYQVSFASGADDSWVLTSGRYFPRAKYGTLWQEDQSQGSQTWDACPLSTHLAWNQYWLNYYTNMLSVMPAFEFTNPQGYSRPQLQSFISQYQASVDRYNGLIKTYG